MQEIIDAQRKFYNTGATFCPAYRKEQLIKLRKSILDNLPELVESFKKDYNKCEFDVYSTEVGVVMHELNYMINHVEKFAKPKRVSTSLINFPSSGYVVSVPRGVVLIVSPWNYPFQLTISPVIGAIAGGNTMVIKPSTKTPNVSATMKKILSVFPEDYCYVSLERDMSLYELRYDFVFYTGSSDFGKTVMEKQSKYLTPCVMELGGKSPCIIDKDADIEIAARRLAWGKFLNGGQTCVAPDYCWVHKSVKARLIAKLLQYIQQFYYVDGVLSENYTYVITEKKVAEVLEMIKGEHLLCGGKANGRSLEPTVVDNITFESPIMSEEIFAPVLPILEFDSLEEVISTLQTKELPLAMYYFSNDKKSIKHMMRYGISGGMCVNDCIMHLTETTLPFGGVGNSGMGSYHGRKSYDTFVHYKSTLVKGSAEMKMKYPPYNNKKQDFLKSYFKLK